MMPDAPDLTAFSTWSGSNIPLSRMGPLEKERCHSTSFQVQLSHREPIPRRFCACPLPSNSDNRAPDAARNWNDLGGSAPPSLIIGSDAKSPASGAFSALHQVARKPAIPVHVQLKPDWGGCDLGDVLYARRCIAAQNHECSGGACAPGGSSLAVSIPTARRFQLLYAGRAFSEYFRFASRPPSAGCFGAAAAAMSSTRNENLTCLAKDRPELTKSGLNGLHGGPFSIWTAPSFRSRVGKSRAPPTTTSKMG